MTGSTRDERAGVDYSFDPPTVAEFAALRASTGWGPVTPEQLERGLAGSWLVATARDDDGAAVGVGRLVSDGGLHALVTELIVLDGLRGRGIGAELLAMLVRAAREAGVASVHLFAAEGRAPFYERNGFAPRPADAPGMDLVR